MAFLGRAGVLADLRRTESELTRLSNVLQGELALAASSGTMAPLATVKFDRLRSACAISMISANRHGC